MGIFRRCPVVGIPGPGHRAAFGNVRQLIGSGANHVPPILIVAMLLDDLRRIDSRNPAVDDFSQDSKVDLLQLEYHRPLVGGCHGCHLGPQRITGVRRGFAEAATDPQEAMIVELDILGRQGSPIHGGFLVPMHPWWIWKIIVVGSGVSQLSARWPLKKDRGWAEVLQSNTSLTFDS